MKPIVITPKNAKELDFVNHLLKKLGISSHVMSDDEIEDIGMSILMRKADRKKKMSKESVMKKLKS